jgi:multidrug efflux pump subunit AcrA (membrane-fusion protein)
MSQPGHEQAISLPFNGCMKLRFAIIVIAILGITGSLAAYYRANGGSDAPKYTTAPAVRGDVIETVEAPGTLGAVTTVQVGSS